MIIQPSAKALLLAFVSLGVASAAAPESVSVVSLNLAKGTDIEAMAREIESITVLRKADVFLFQEAVKTSSDRLSSAEQLAHRLRLYSTFASPDGANTDLGLCIASRYPLRDVKVRQLQNVNLVFRSRRRIALAVTIETPSGSTRIVNAHLDTRISPAERLKQLQPALDEARTFGGPAIVGGDFNTNDMQWVSHVVPVPHPGWQAAAVRKLMLQEGFVTPFELRQATFDHLRMQLDWIFATGFKPQRSSIHPLGFSDHHAIWAEFTPKVLKVGRQQPKSSTGGNDAYGGHP